MVCLVRSGLGLGLLTACLPAWVACGLLWAGLKEGQAFGEREAWVAQAPPRSWRGTAQMSGCVAGCCLPAGVRPQSDRRAGVGIALMAVTVTAGNHTMTSAST